MSFCSYFLSQYHTALSSSNTTATRPWTEEELSLLAKAVAKYPGGIQERWQLVSDFVGTRSVKEIISKTKETKYGKYIELQPT